MADGTGTLTATPALEKVGWEEKGWIHTRRFDLAMFSLSPLAGLALIWGAMYLPFGRYLGPGAFYFVAIPHYLSTFTFFLADDNLAYYKTRRAAFFLGPVIICVVVVAMVGSGYNALFQSLQFTWNIWHVSAQSAGILSLYRRLNGGPYDERPIALTAILGVNCAMTFSHLSYYPPLYQTLAQVHPDFPRFLFLASLPVAIGALAFLAYRITRRPRAISVPELTFLASSLLMFHPYLWVRDLDLATLAMLMGHFVQYLAIVWLLHRRKYGPRVGQGSARQRILGTLSTRTPLLLETLFMSGMLIFIAERAARGAGVGWAYQIPWNVLTITHFYLDGLIWAFKRPYIRQSMGPYLTLDSHMA